MCSVFRTFPLLLILSCLSLASSNNLRVCEDPNNLPYSNAQGHGYEIELAQLTGNALGRNVQFVWVAQRGDFLRKSLIAGKCDVMLSVPSGMDELAVTRPYYRSSYAFVMRKDRHLDIRSFDDPRLKHLRIGVQILQNEGGSATPAADALIHRQLANNIVWYRIFPNFIRSNPAAALVEGVEAGDIDVAVAWGPLAGYCARTSAIALDVVPVSPQLEQSVPLAFNISMGVRPGDTKLCSALNGVITRRQAEIHKILIKYGIPAASRKS